MEISYLQAALFFDQIIPDAVNEIKNIISKFSNELSKGEYFELPFSEGDSEMTPRTVLKSSDDLWMINIAPGRIDIIYNLGEGGFQTKIKDGVLEWHEFQQRFLNRRQINFVRDFIIDFVHHSEKIVGIKRIGVIGRSFRKVNKPAKYIADKVFNIHREDYTELAIRFNKPLAKESFDLNRIYQYENANMTVNINDKNGDKSLHAEGMVTQIDINNAPSKDKILMLKQILEIYDYALEEFKKQ